MTITVASEHAPASTESNAAFRDIFEASIPLEVMDINFSLNSAGVYLENSNFKMSTLEISSPPKGSEYPLCPVVCSYTEQALLDS